MDRQGCQPKSGNTVTCHSDANAHINRPFIRRFIALVPCLLCYLICAGLPGSYFDVLMLIPFAETNMCVFEAMLTAIVEARSRKCCFVQHTIDRILYRSKHESSTVVGLLTALPNLIFLKSW
ncbi:hypothetical protein EDB86DRAFT_2149912 [Lactarius hatsudake]|nr:hypothetical protein EDB86DRAFT_2149912 [Lactarius hatsudake]